LPCTCPHGGTTTSTSKRRLLGGCSRAPSRCTWETSAGATTVRAVQCSRRVHTTEVMDTLHSSHWNLFTLLGLTLVAAMADVLAVAPWR
jgi:hypothetical protein